MAIWKQFSDKELLILKARARQMAQSAADTTPERATVAALSVQVNDTVYAFPIEHLTAVYFSLSIIPVPSVPAYIQGIANIRGRITPVINLPILLNPAQSKALPETYYLLVASKGANTVAFFVEQIGDLLMVAVDELSAIAEHTVGRRYLSGLTPDEHCLLNLAAILDDETLIVKRNMR